MKLYRRHLILNEAGKLSVNITRQDWFWSIAFFVGGLPYFLSYQLYGLEILRLSTLRKFGPSATILLLVPAVIPLFVAAFSMRPFVKLLYARFSVAPRIAAMQAMDTVIIEMFFLSGGNINISPPLDPKQVVAGVPHVSSDNTSMSISFNTK